MKSRLRHDSCLWTVASKDKPARRWWNVIVAHLWENITIRSEVCLQATILHSYITIAASISPYHPILKDDHWLCMFCNEKHVHQGLVKNAQSIVEHLHPQYLYSSMHHQQLNRSTQRISTHPEIHFEFTPSHTSWTVHYLQFPLHLAYAATSNSCADLTLTSIILRRKER